MYQKASKALRQGTLPWERRNKVPVEEPADWDNEITQELNDLLRLGAQRTKDEIKRSAEE
jgi:hypothetical protein